MADASVSVRIGLGNGSFLPPVTWAAGPTTPAFIEIEDLNEDGRPDLLASNFGDIAVPDTGTPSRCCSGTATGRSPLRCLSRDRAQALRARRRRSECRRTRWMWRSRTALPSRSRSCWERRRHVRSAHRLPGGLLHLPGRGRRRERGRRARRRLRRRDPAGNGSRQLLALALHVLPVPGRPRGSGRRRAHGSHGARLLQQRDADRARIGQRRVRDAAFRLRAGQLDRLPGVRTTSTATDSWMS